jgi:predicted enzyme related to lactoylglutathione lyase
MSIVEKHAPGSFAWIELATTDQNAAKAFYTSLLSWSFVDFPMGPAGVYTMFSLKDRSSGAAYTISAEELAQHIPPHWQLYIAVDSADETAKRATELGGKVVLGPFDVDTHGRMALIQDPTGAFFSIWQAKAHLGTGIQNEPGTLCWADLNTKDSKKASDFYAGLFGWKIEPGQDGTGYLHIKNGEEFIGGIPPAEHQDPNAPPHWLQYILVSDCDASTEKARQLGAKIYMGPMTIEKVGRMTVLADPQGAVFSLFQQMRS